MSKLRLSVELCLLLTLMALGQSAASQAAPPTSNSTGSSKLVPGQNQPQANQWSNDPREWPYGQKAFARAVGNAGGWWSFLTEPEKQAFLDGYWNAMKQSLAKNETLCTVFKDGLKTSSDTQAFINQTTMVSFVCQQSKEFDGFEKITVKDLDEFYSDRVNQPIPLEWSMAYLRDKATGKKTEGQLLDALRTQQRDIHDCSKYGNLCKLGMPESTSGKR
jgi:hypothetical protein